MLEIQRVLDAAAKEEENMRRQSRNDVKSTWNEAIKFKNIMKSMPEPDIEPAKPFAGEDLYHDERVQAQQDQMKRWIQEQLNEKAQIQSKQSYEEKKYYEMQQAILQLREQAEKDEFQMRNSIVREVKDQNLSLARTQQQLRYQENHQLASTDPQTTTIPMTNDINAAFDSNGRIYRRDMFRGYTDAQRRRILEENQSVVEEKKLVFNNVFIFISIYIIYP